MPHVLMFIARSIFQLPFVGLKRSGELIARGRIGAVMGGVLGIIPYAAGLLVIVLGFIGLVREGAVLPLDDAGLGKAGGLAGCFAYLLVTVVGVGIEYLGYGIQTAFAGGIKITEMEWE